MKQQEVLNRLAEGNCSVSEKDGDLFVIVNNHKQGEICEEEGLQWGFYDEYATCGICYQVTRITADSYHWTVDYQIIEGELICGECIRQDYKREYIAELINNPKKANTILEEETLWEEGFKMLEEGEGGLHDMGESDDPAEQMKKYNDNYDILFHITGTGQFQTRWELWGKQAE